MSQGKLPKIPLEKLPFQELFVALNAIAQHCAVSQSEALRDPLRGSLRDRNSRDARLVSISKKARLILATSSQKLLI